MAAEWATLAEAAAALAVAWHRPVSVGALRKAAEAKRLHVWLDDKDRPRISPLEMTRYARTNPTESTL